MSWSVVSIPVKSHLKAKAASSPIAVVPHCVMLCRAVLQAKQEPKLLQLVDDIFEACIEQVSRFEYLLPVD